MAKKGYTVMVVPKKGSKIRNFHVSGKAIGSLGVSLALSVLAGIFMVYRTLDYSSKVGELEKLQEEYNQQQVAIQSVSKSISAVKKELTNLQKFSQKFRIIAGLPPRSENLQQAAGLGGDVEQTFLGFSRTLEGEFLKKMHQDIERLKLEIRGQQDNMEELSDAVDNRRSLFAATPAIWPIRGWLTSGFGYRNSPFTGQREMHQGIDVATRFGSPIKATAAGIVTYSGRDGGLGNVVVVEHGYGYCTRFGHMSETKVKVGERVARGDVVGYVGNTGRSTGPHLHYEVRVNGVAVSPFNYILD